MKEAQLPQPEYTTRTTCRSCESPQLEEVLSLGTQHLAAWSADERSVAKVPLDLIRCCDCSLVQLRHTTRPDLLWNSEYGYKSGINQTMRDHLAGIAKSVEGTVPLDNWDVVVDIGCNDGTLLGSYANLGITRVGFDPSGNVIAEAREKLPGARLINDFFNKEAYTREFGSKKAKVVTAISMFYDLEDPNRFVADVKEILDKDGVFVVQQNYLSGMLTQTAYDNICHEHLEYYSLGTMESLLARHGLEIFDVEQNSLNGGSFRTYIRHSGSKIDRKGSEDRLWQMRTQERLTALGTEHPYKRFAERAKREARKLGNFVARELANGKTFYIYGASTRGNTLLQYAGLDYRHIKGAAERNPDKWGKRTVGTNIPIVSEEEARAAKPDYFLVLPWFFKTEFVEREKDYIEQGGALVFPLPRLEVVDECESRQSRLQLDQKGYQL